MMTETTHTYCIDQFTTDTYVESLCCTSETNRMLSIIFQKKIYIYILFCVVYTHTMDYSAIKKGNPAICDKKYVRER